MRTNLLVATVFLLLAALLAPHSHESVLRHPLAAAPRPTLSIEGIRPGMTRFEVWMLQGRRPVVTGDPESWGPAGPNSQQDVFVWYNGDIVRAVEGHHIEVDGFPVYGRWSPTEAAHWLGTPTRTMQDDGSVVWSYRSNTLRVINTAYGDSFTRFQLGD